MERKIFVVGIGPGSPEDVTPAVRTAISESDVIVGYHRYIPFVTPWLRPDAECVDTGMKHERERAEQAFRYAEEGRTVCVISSGDAGIYGMASLIYEMQSRGRGEGVEIVPLPGISAFQKAASLLGAPVSHDFCVLSMSDLMTPWAVIERRIRAAAEADFVTAVYNPRSNERYWQLHRLKELFLLCRNAETPVGYVRQAGREGQHVVVTTLGDFNPDEVDMFTIVIIGNSQSYTWQGHIITPRGYYKNDNCSKSIGQDIMMQSFATIRRELRHPDIPLWRLWPLLHTIHTTADFAMERILWMDEAATEKIFAQISSGKLRTIVTDVTMAASGIRKGALERLGLSVLCYLSDPRAEALAREQGLTRAQAGIRIAVSEHPDALFAIGNAPTALLELCRLVRQGKCCPAGIIGAPVGFVHVEESKHAAKTLTAIPKLLIEGRKGGSTLAATLVNSILTYDDAATLMPGRDV
ncbi:MAG: precorrin-3B C(17)-methyltransferase [Bacteroidaceae bacterium]|nr:precorrin-3B C(17)-methyltransferase [Bacteroidaceae bacterium]